MVLSQSKLQGILGSEADMPLGEPLIIENGTVDCGIFFYITQKAMEAWSKENLNMPDTPKANAGLSMLLRNTRDFGALFRTFSNRNHARFTRLLRGLLMEIISHYGPFPSAKFPVQNIAFIFDVSESSASCSNVTKDFEIIKMKMSIDSLNLADAQLANFIKHELFHLIAELKEGQERVIIEVSKLQAAFSESINKDKKAIESSVQHLLDYCKRHSFHPEEFAEQFNMLVGYFYRYYAERFWNLVSDSALCIIAIELEDMDFVRSWIENDRSMVVGLGERLGNADAIMNHVIKEEPDQDKKKFFIQAIKIIQFMECFNGMPFFAIAYGVLGEGWKERMKGRILRNLRIRWHRNESSRNIYTFKALVKSYCHAEVSERFLRFYDAYLNIVKAQAIRNNPLDQNIRRQIHDTEAIQRSEEAYKILNQEFSSLFKELRKYAA